MGSYITKHWGIPRSWRPTRSDLCVQTLIHCTFSSGRPIRVSMGHPWTLEQHSKIGNRTRARGGSPAPDPCAQRQIHCTFSSGRPIRVATGHPWILEQNLKLGTTPALVEAHPVQTLMYRGQFTVLFQVGYRFVCPRDISGF